MNFTEKLTAMTTLVATHMMLSDELVETTQHLEAQENELAQLEYDLEEMYSYHQEILDSEAPIADIQDVLQNIEAKIKRQRGLLNDCIDTIRCNKIFLEELQNEMLCVKEQIEDF